MAGGLSSRSRSAGADYIWPGYVDALTTLLMVLIFLLSILSVAQFSLSTALSTKDSAIDTLGKQISTLVEQLSLAKQTATKLQADLSTATLALGQARSDRDSAKADRDRLAAAAKAAMDKTAALQTEIDRQTAEATRLAASLAAANNEKGKLFDNLTEQEKQTAEQKANVVRLTAQLQAIKDELAKLSTVLEAADVKAKQQQAQIFDLGQQLNRALVSKVEELARYRSEFFGKLKEALAGQRDVQVVGDRFVFQSEVLFPSGSAELQPGGEKQLGNVAQRLLEISAKIPKEIPWVLQVDGHTDNKPINTRVFPSNWELSSARAIAVVKYLNSQGIANDHLVAAGYGEFQPLSLMDTARNRRIELKLTNR